MQLNINQIKEITLGAANIFQGSDGIEFHRFTEKQEELYHKTNEIFWDRCFCTAGIKLLFRTDSKNLCLKIAASRTVDTRSYFSFDVFSDGRLVGYLDNFSDIDLPQDNYMWVDAPLGKFRKCFELGEGTKEVCIHFPWSVSALLSELSLDDGCFVETVKPKKKLLAFGDSITHGFDAYRPSNRYIAILADKLEAEEHNKAIGGERFFPELASLKDDFEPDYITVAYGTNDWNSGMSMEEFSDNCRLFYENLRKNHLNSKIIAITPIWRADMDMGDKFCRFKDMYNIIANIVKDINNVDVISGFDFVPHDEKYYGDLRLHPNDEGFGFYADSLYKQISNLI